MEANIIKKIEAIVGADNCTTLEEDLHCYSFDGAGKIYLPEAVAFPQTTEQVSKIMKLATESRFPVVPRGAGSGIKEDLSWKEKLSSEEIAKLNKILEKNLVRFNYS